jgi:hypothetical protein
MTLTGIELVRAVTAVRDVELIGVLMAIRSELRKRGHDRAADFVHEAALDLEVAVDKAAGGLAS